MACRCFLLAISLLFSAKAQSGSLADSSQANAVTRGGSSDGQPDGEATHPIAIASIQPSNVSQVASLSIPCGFPHYSDGCRKSGSHGCGANGDFIACDIVQDDPKKPSWTKKGVCTKTAYVLETSFGCLEAASKSLLESISVPNLAEALYANGGTCEWWDVRCKTLVGTAHSIGEIKPVTAANDCHAMGYQSSKCIGKSATPDGCSGDSPFYAQGLDIHCAIVSGPQGGTVANAICAGGQFGCQPRVSPSPPAFFA